MKALDIETQSIDSIGEKLLLQKLLEIAKEAGYTEVHDHWGQGAYDTYTIDEAIDRFKPDTQIEIELSDDIPF